jgi:hypothetical protein
MLPWAGRGEDQLSFLAQEARRLAVIVQVGEIGESRSNPTLGVQTTMRFLQRKRVQFPKGLFNQSGMGSFRFSRETEPRG